MESSHPDWPSVDNQLIADLFLEVSDLLEAQHADFYRVRGWREGAAAVRAHAGPVVDVLGEGGRPALVALAHIGEGLAAAIEEIAHTGRLGVLERLRGHVSPEDLFVTIPGVGEELASRIHHELHVETLEDLEAAAHDGRLQRIEGVGPRRAEAIRDILEARLSRGSRRHARRLEPARASQRASDPLPPQPPVDLLMHVDRDYRDLAEQGRLPRVAPSRFNPTHEAWLPVMHRYTDGWDFHVMYSNTAIAHRLDRIRDWVVIYWHHGSHEGQCTVVTEYRGPLEGLRVIRGREEECKAWHGGHRGPTGREIVDAWLASLPKLSVLFAVFLLVACAAQVEVRRSESTTTTSAQAGPESALLLTADGYQLHYSEGQVYQLTFAGADVAPLRRAIDSFKEFRELYLVDAAAPVDLPERLPDAGVTVSGWRGQECVRAGHAGGPMSADPPPGVLVRLTLRFAR